MYEKKYWFLPKVFKDEKKRRYERKDYDSKIGVCYRRDRCFKNRQNLDEFKNKFYLDEKDKISQKHFICVDKNKFYDKPKEIIDIFTKKIITDFTVNKNAHDNNMFELNIIDPGKYDQIENAAKEVENLWYEVWYNFI